MHDRGTDQHARELVAAGALTMAIGSCGGPTARPVVDDDGLVTGALRVAFYGTGVSQLLGHHLYELTIHECAEGTDLGDVRASRVPVPLVLDEPSGPTVDGYEVGPEDVS